MGMLDRKYSAGEITEIGALGTLAMGDVPQTVRLAAHLAAANAMMADVVQVGRLSPDFQNAARALNAVATLFVLVCETGPVSPGRPQ